MSATKELQEKVIGSLQSNSLKNNKFCRTEINLMIDFKENRYIDGYFAIIYHTQLYF